MPPCSRKAERNTFGVTRFSRREFLGAAALALGVPLLNREVRAMESSSGVARLEISHPRRFRILQLTDLHFFSRDKTTWNAFNRRTVEQMQSLVQCAKPDLLIITGDVWSEDQNGLGEKHMRYAVQRFEALGVPWAFTWGNHDQLKDFEAGHRILAEARNSLYRGADSDGNYVIDVIDLQARRVWQIVCINSRREGIRKEQQRWLKGLPRIDSPRFAFFHIPLKQYDDIWRNGAAAGIYGEEPFTEKEDGSTLPILKSLGVVACFCGHDHQNDYSGLADGVELVYGRVSRSGGYGADTFQKGGKLITVNCTRGSFKWKSLTPDGARWHPARGQRTIMAD